MEGIEKLFYDIARKQYDGHYTILAFTTNYAVCFGTILNAVSSLCVDKGCEYQYKCIDSMAKGKTLEEAMLKCITENIDNIQIHKKFDNRLK